MNLSSISVLASTAIVVFAVFGCEMKRDNTHSISDYPIVPRSADDYGTETIPWARSDLVMHRYELQSEERYADYYFTEYGGVIAGIGNKKERETITYPSFHWRIGNDGLLIMSDEKDGDPHTILALVSIGHENAQIRDVNRDALENYTRRMTD